MTIKGVEEKNCRNFVLKLVLNRIFSTILGMFKEYVVPRSIIITDGYPSCLGAVVELDVDLKSKLLSWVY